MLGELSLPALAVIAVTYFFLRTSLFMVIGYWVSQKTKFGRNHQIYRVPLATGQLKSEIRAAVFVVILDALVLAGVKHFGLISFSPFSWSSFVLSIFLLYLWFEVWFYSTHRLMHHPKLFWIHRQHHVAKVTTPVSAMSFSLLERVILLIGILGFTIFLVQFIPVCFETLIVYSIANTVFNVLGHMNVEIYPEWYGRSKLSWILSTPTFHAIHHARMKGHYGLFTTVLDHAFGSAFPDHAEMQAQAARGVGFDRLQVKLPTLQNSISKTASL